MRQSQSVSPKFSFGGFAYGGIGTPCSLPVDPESSMVRLIGSTEVRSSNKVHVNIESASCRGPSSLPRTLHFTTVLHARFDQIVLPTSISIIRPLRGRLPWLPYFVALRGQSANASALSVPPHLDPSVCNGTTTTPKPWPRSFLITPTALRNGTNNRTAAYTGANASNLATVLARSSRTRHGGLGTPTSSRGGCSASR